MRIEPTGEKHRNDTAKTKDSKENLHKTFSKMIILSQCFGYFPVQGLLGDDHHSLYFQWRSFRVLYAIFTILGASFVSIMQIHKIAIRGMDLMEADRLFFYFSGVASGWLFFKLARSWPALMKDWSGVEMSMTSYGWPTGLNRRLNTILIVFMLLAVVEYVLNQSNRIVMSINCHTNTDEAMTYYFGNMSYSHIFTVMNYDIVKGILLQFVNLQLSFAWTFNDLFVMIISTALAQRLNQITGRIQSVAETKIENEIIWKNLREDYNRLCRFCRRIDDEISYIVLLTFASDLFFILVQLFNSLRSMRNDLERIYFYWSFGLLILRTVCLCLYGAKVNDESKKPIIILNSVSSKVYNLEIQRFIQQIGTSEVAITGKNFFSITRGLILSIAGAIVTYELVLIQFNDSLLKNEEDKGACPIFV